MSLPYLDLTRIGQTQQRQNYHIWTRFLLVQRTTDPNPQTLQPELSKRTEKVQTEYVLEYLESDPLSS